jgi:acyl-CoA thioester hydrolase
MTPSAAVPHTIDVEVRYAETDQMGVVHHAAYLVWLELARTALCASSGHPYPEIERHGYWLMVTGVHVSYRGGARYGDTVRVAAWIERLASRLLHFGYAVTRGDERLVTATTEHVWVEAATRRPCRMPDFVAPDFRRLAGLEDLNLGADSASSAGSAFAAQKQA